MIISVITAIFHPSLAAMGAPIANHLWQSTLFALTAGLMTVILRKNHAQVRYWLWLVASAKFLVPFSVLVDVGSHLSRANGVRGSALLLVIQEIGQPFASAKPSQAAVPVASTVLATAGNLLPALLLIAWLCGCVALLFVWWRRWRHITVATRAASPLRSGREFAALRRLEQSSGLRGRIGLIVTSSGLEPGILGIFRPILVLPTGIPNRLTDGELEAVIAHELCHVRRYDNLASAFHMLIETLFWFHPLIWWIGARLIDERERACDEEVLRSGRDPQVYAESILKVCKSYLESPLPCIAGVTGSNLKKRIEAIMTHHSARNLGWSRKLLLGAAAITTIGSPVSIGFLSPASGRAQSQAQTSMANGLAFESISIKPNNSDSPMVMVFFKGDTFTATKASLHGLIRMAYGVQDSQISGGPDWINSGKYDIEAKIGSSAADQLSNLSSQQAMLIRQQLVQALLVDRFKLAIHREMRDLPDYELLVGDGGLKIRQAKPDDNYTDGAKGFDGRPIGRGTLVFSENYKLVGQGIPMAELVKELSRRLGRRVVDKTGLPGNYNFILEWTPDTLGDDQPILRAMQEQLGLKLQAQEGLAEVLIIDGVEKPSGN
jgi:bla regulator protein BlaR1